jgi:hypothetical protein
MSWRTAVEGPEVRALAADPGIPPNGIRLTRSRVPRRLREDFGDPLNP